MFLLPCGTKAFLSITPKAEVVKEKNVRFVYKEKKSFHKSINTLAKTRKKMPNGRIYVT